MFIVNAKRFIYSEQSTKMLMLAKGAGKPLYANQNRPRIYLFFFFFGLRTIHYSSNWMIIEVRSTHHTLMIKQTIGNCWIPQKILEV